MTASLPFRSTSSIFIIIFLSLSLSLSLLHDFHYLIDSSSNGDGDGDGDGDGHSLAVQVLHVLGMPALPVVHATNIHTTPSISSIPTYSSRTTRSSTSSTSTESSSMLGSNDTNNDINNDTKAQEQQNNSSSSSSSSNNKRSDSNLVTLDLAGQFNVHLSSPSSLTTIDDIMANNNNHNNHNNYNNQNNNNYMIKEKKLYSTKPLFQWGKENKVGGIVPVQIQYPHLHVGGQYDFKKVWSGLTRVMTTMSWGGGGATATATAAAAAAGSSTSTGTANPTLRSTSIKVSAEKGLLTPNDYALDLGLIFPTTTKYLLQGQSRPRQKQRQRQKQHTKPTSVILRYETTNREHRNHMTTSITAKTSSLHPRLTIVGKSIVKLVRVPMVVSSFKIGGGTGTGPNDSTSFRFPFKMLPRSSSSSSTSTSTSTSTLSSSPFLSRIQQRKLQLSDEASWIPDINITPGGKVISKNSFGITSLPHIGTTTKTNNNKDHDSSGSNFNTNTNMNRVGIRLSVKKQINWNILGSLFPHQQQFQQSQSQSQQMMSYQNDDNDDYDQEYDFSSSSSSSSSSLSSIINNGDDTLVRLEVCGLTGVNSYTSLSIEAALERIRQTFHCTILQEGVIN